MRIERLQLEHYGHFDRLPLTFPEREPDLHIVYGPNEAGKSTVLRAVVDLLCGIPQRRPYPFPHRDRAMRLEADLVRLVGKDRAGRTKTFARQRGHTAALPEAVWPHGPIDRDSYERLFGLDHERLRIGGQELLDSKGEIGRALLGATTGLERLGELRDTLRSEAEELWIPAPAARRRFHELRARLRELDEELASLEIPGSEWAQRRRAVEELEEQYRAVEEGIRRSDGERRRLARIRAVLPLVRRRRALEGAVAEIGDLPALPEDAGELLAEAERRAIAAEGPLETLRTQIREQERQKGQIRYDPKLLIHEGEIERISERRGVVAQELEDLPRRRAELEEKEKRLRELAAELGWPGEVDTIHARLPAAVAVRRVRELLQERAALVTRVEGAESASIQAAARVEELDRRLRTLPEAAEPKPLANAVAAVERAGDVGERIRAAEARCAHARDELEPILARMDPPVTEEALEGLRVPAREAVEAHRDRVREIERCMERRRESRENLERERSRLRAERDRLAREEGAVSAEELAGVRRHRDRGWELIRRRHVEGENVPDEEIAAFVTGTDGLVVAYERAVREADAAADRRFDKVCTAARLAEIERTIHGREAELAELDQQERQSRMHLEELETAWRALWVDTGLEPHAPEAMLAWLHDRDRALEVRGRWREARSELASLRERERELREMLLEALGEVGRSGPEPTEAPLALVLETARARLEELNDTQVERRRLVEALEDARRNLDRYRHELERTRAGLQRWEEEWRQALAAAALDPEVAPTTAEARLQVIDAIRGILAEIRELRERRIVRIERDSRQFTEAANLLFTRLAPDLVEADPLTAVLELRNRLVRARELATRHQQIEQTIANLRRQLGEVENQWRQAKAVIDRLLTEAGVEDVETLRGLLQRAERLHELRAELQEVDEGLRRHGEGRSVEELEGEIAAVDPDTLPAELERLELELRVLQEQRPRLHTKREDARRRLEEIGGDDAVVHLRGEREEVVAALREVAARYLRLTAAGLLLDRAESLFREEGRPALLRRSGEIFAALTRGAFGELDVESGDNGALRLYGVRPEGAAVAVEEMSDGTVDQLFLALRIAALEGRVKERRLPFVADDLLVNFDDERAKAALHVLAGLASHTQVLVFTHHRHLLDLARETLGDELSIIELRETAAAGG